MVQVFMHTSLLMASKINLLVDIGNSSISWKIGDCYSRPQWRIRAAASKVCCQVIIWKALQWTIVYSVFGKYHTDCIFKTSFVDFKEYAHCTATTKTNGLIPTQLSILFQCQLSHCPIYSIYPSFLHSFYILMNMFSS
jgi:hypothetical protein